jgi:hypothetical protein
MASGSTWPKEGKYPSGPYKYLVKSYRIQTGRCPEPHDLGSKVSISIWDFGEENRLFYDTFRSDSYFEDIHAKFQKDGSAVVVDQKTKRTIRYYSRISDNQWRYKP